MRNLKRVLSLALALVMVLGMMVITTSAADFTDADEITYTEAVDVISAIGVINGFEAADGTFYFDGDATLTREQGAAFVCYLLMGKTAADKLAGSGNFSDVAADRWSAGEIDYCYNLGLIKGNPDGTFNPEGPLTSVAFGRMLLGALGYDGDVEGYTGDNWATNIAADMIDIGLDVNGVAMDAQLTREQAAQMALQALECNMVKYASKGSSISINGVDIVTGASEAEPRTWKGTAAADRVDYNGGVSELGDDDTIQFCEKYFSKLTKGTGLTELFGRKGYTWNITGKPAAVSEFIVTDKVLATSNNGTSWADLNNINKPTYIGVKANDVIAYYYNGAAVAGDTESDEANDGVGGWPVATDDLAANITNVKNAIDNTGVIAEFIDTLPYDGKYDVVNVTVKTVATLTAASATKEVKGQDTQVIVPGVINTYSAANTVKDVVGYEGLVKGDVVLTYEADGVRFIELADKVSGKVTGLTNGEPVVNGTAYEDSGLAGAANGWVNDYKNTYDFYLDNAGAIVKTVKTTEEAAAVYAIPVETSWVTGTGKIDEDNYAEAKLLFVDGTTKVVTLTEVNGKTVVADTDALIASDEIEIGDVTTGVFYTYAIDKDGNYELTSVSQDALDYNTITTGKANFDSDSNNDGTGTDNNVASVATTFIVKTMRAGKPVYTVYNGINEIPNMTASAGTVIADRTGIATYVYVTATATSGSNNDYVVIVPNRAGNGFDSTAVPNALGTGIDHYVVKAIVNGTEQDIKLKTLNIEDGTGAVDQDKLYQVATIGADGVITGLTTVSMDTGVQVVSGTLTAGSDSYTTDADTVFYYIDDEGAVSTLDNTTVTADGTDAVYVAKSTNGKAELVYILQVLKNTTTASYVKYSIDGVDQGMVAPATGIQAPAGSVVTITAVITADEATYTLSSSTFTADGILTIRVVSEDGKVETSTTTCAINFVAAEEPVDYTGSEDDNTAYVGLDLTERFGVVARFVFEETTSADELVAVLYSGKTVLAEATYTANGGVFEGTSIGLTFNGKDHDSGSWTGENFVEDDDLIPDAVALVVDGVEYVKYDLEISAANWATLKAGSCLCGDC